MYDVTVKFTGAETDRPTCELFYRKRSEMSQVEYGPVASAEASLIARVYITDPTDIAGKLAVDGWADSTAAETDASPLRIAAVKPRPCDVSIGIPLSTCGYKLALLEKEIQEAAHRDGPRSFGIESPRTVAQSRSAA